MEYNTTDIAKLIATWFNRWDADPHKGYDIPEYWEERLEVNIESVYDDFDICGEKLIYQSDEAEGTYLEILDIIHDFAVIME